MLKIVKTTYQLNGKKVLKKQFESFFNTLAGIEDWTCKIISGGGVVTYTARDQKSQEYLVMLESGKQNRQTITKKI